MATDMENFNPKGLKSVKHNTRTTWYYAWEPGKV